MGDELVMVMKEWERERSEGFVRGSRRRWRWRCLGYGVCERPRIAFETEGESH